MNRIAIAVISAALVSFSSIMPAQGAANKAGMTPDEAESLLEGGGESDKGVTPGGIFLLENQYTFNVLDSVYYDPGHRQLSLIGHFDKRFSGRRIPYLQHLATLLETPNPQFSLAWTADSEKRINGLFAQHISQSESDSITDKWGNLYDKEGNLTKSGEYLLPVFGVSPISGNHRPGSMGVDVVAVPNTLYVKVSRVNPDSPAARAGLEVGDVIKTINATPPFSPAEFDHFIRLRGEGGSVPTEYIHSASGKRNFATITLGASDDHNVWRAATDQFSVARALYFAAGNDKAGQCVDMFGTLQRVKAKYRVPEEVSNNMEMGLYYTMGLWDDVVAARKAGFSKEVAENFVTQYCRAIDEIFGFDGTPVTDAFTRARDRGDGADALGAVVTAEFKRQFVPKLEALLNPIFDRPEGLQIPPELVEDHFHIHPEMMPHYIGINEHSQLARAMFASDYLCKRLMDRPELKQTIPNYETGFEFEVKHPEFRHTTGNYRIWISVDKMDTPQSADRKTLAFRDVKMRFNIRDESGNASDGSGMDMPNKPGNYEDLLTSLWYDLEQEYPTLHELRESAKVAAAAKWILLHNPSATLPKAGRVSWQGPSKVPGLVFFEMMTDLSRATKTKVIIIANGGVSLVPFPKAGVDNPFPVDSSVVTDPSFMDSRDRDVHDAVADTTGGGKAVASTRSGYLDSEEKDLLERLTQPRTDEEKAALLVQLSHIRAAKGDAKGATDAWKQALNDNADATYKAEHSFQAAKEAADTAALSPGRGSLSVRNPTGGMMLPFEQQPNVSQASLNGSAEADWVVAQDFYYQGFKRPESPSQEHLPPPQLFKNPEDIKKFDNYLASKPALKEQLVDNAKAWEKEDQDYQQKLKTNQGVAAERLKREMEMHNKEFKDDLKKKLEKDPDYQKLHVEI